MKVLMIDDEPVFYKMAASVLTNRGYELEDFYEVQLIQHRLKFHRLCKAIAHVRFFYQEYRPMMNGHRWEFFRQSQRCLLSSESA